LFTYDSETLYVNIADIETLALKAYNVGGGSHAYGLAAWGYAIVARDTDKTEIEDFLYDLIWVPQDPGVAELDLAYISDLRWRAYTGNAQRDRESTGTEKLNMDGMVFEKGVFLEPYLNGPIWGGAYIEVNINELGFVKFSTYIGVPRSSIHNITMATVTFTVFADGTQIYTKDMGYADEPELLNFDIADVSLLKLQVTATNNNFAGAWGAWAGAILSKDEDFDLADFLFDDEYWDNYWAAQNPDTAALDKAFISDLRWRKEVAYESVSRDELPSGELIYMGGTFFSKGVCIHGIAFSEAYIEINIKDLGFISFASYIGIPVSFANDISMATVTFVIYADGTELYRKDMVFGDAMEQVSVDVTGASFLKLTVIATGGNMAGCWGTWGNALLSKSDDPEDLFCVEPFVWEEIEEPKKPSKPEEPSEPEEPEEPLEDDPKWSGALKAQVAVAGTLGGLTAAGAVCLAVFRKKIFG